MRHIAFYLFETIKLQQNVINFLNNKDEKMTLVDLELNKKKVFKLINLYF